MYNRFSFSSIRSSGLLFFVLVATAGCGGSGSPGVQVDVAKTSLEKALAAWSQGKSVSSLSIDSPKIIVGDNDWESGRKLESFQFQSTPFDDGANLHVTVMLTFADDPESTREPDTEEVTYVVGTHPIVTIFRK